MFIESLLEWDSGTAFRDFSLPYKFNLQFAKFVKVHFACLQEQEQNIMTPEVTSNSIFKKYISKK